MDLRYEWGAELLVPLKSGEGRYVASESVLDELEGEGRVVFADDQQFVLYRGYQLRQRPVRRSGAASRRDRAADRTVR